MAIIKTINSPATSSRALKNCLKYISKDNEIGSELCFVRGPMSGIEFDWEKAYEDFMTEKDIWNKDGGRMYLHNVISFHKDEDISLEQIMEYGKEFIEKWFVEYQCVMAVHIEKDHKHIHIVTNSVNYINGKKYHQTKRDLQKMKDIINDMSRSRGLSVPQKGKDFYGEDIERKTIRSWNKDEYNLLKRHPEKSYLANALDAIHEAIKGCKSQENFVLNMEKLGWKVHISEKRKYITLEDAEGHKVRDSRLSDKFNINFNKESLKAEFEKNINRANVERTDLGELELEREFSPYYQDVEKALDIDEVDDLEVAPTLENKDVWNAEMQRIREENQGRNKKSHKKKHDEYEHER